MLNNGLENYSVRLGLDSWFYNFSVALRETVPRLKGGTTPMKTIYYDNHGSRNQLGFRGGGSAWWVRPQPDRPWDEHFAEFDVSEQLYWALFRLRIIEDFCGLSHDGLLGAYEEGILRSSTLGNASELLNRRAQNLSPRTFEWDCSKQLSPDKIEYKILVDAEALKQELMALADFLDAAASRGFDVQLWL